MRDGSNKRTDEYGGSIENRLRFPMEVLDQLIEVYGANRVGMKVSPNISYNGMSDSNTEELFSHLMGELSKRKILFVENMDLPIDTGKSLHSKLKSKFNGVFVANGGFT